MKFIDPHRDPGTRSAATTARRQHHAAPHLLLDLAQWHAVRATGRRHAGGVMLANDQTCKRSSRPAAPGAGGAAVPEVGRRPRLQPGAAAALALPLRRRGARHRRRAGRHGCRCCARTGFDAVLLRADQSARRRRARAGLLPRPLPGRRHDNRPLFASRPAPPRRWRAAQEFVNEGRRYERGRAARAASAASTASSAHAARAADAAAGRTRRPHRAGHQPGRRGHGADRPDRAPPPADRAGHARDRQAARRDAGPDPAHRAALRPRGRASSRRCSEAVVQLRAPPRRARDVRQHRPAQGLLRRAQARAAGPHARRPQRLGHRAAPRADRRTAPWCRSASSEDNGRVKFNPLADWTWADVWHYIAVNDVPYNPLHDQFFPSIGCAPCTRAIALGEDFRAGRWWWEDEDAKECGLHVRAANEAKEPRHERPARPSNTCCPALDHTHLDRLEEEAIFILREVAASVRAPGPAVLRRQGLVRRAAPGREGLQAAQRRAADFEGRLPFPLLHVDTGHNFPEVIEFRDQRVAEMGERLVVGHLEDSIAPRHRAAGAPARIAQRPPDRDAARGDRGAPLRRADRRRAARRGEGARQGAHLQPPRQLRPMAAEGAAARAVDAVQHARIRPGEHFRAFPISNWTELDVWLYIARENIPLPSLYYAHAPRRDPAQGPARAADRRHAAAGRRDGRNGRRCAFAPSAT